MIVATPTEAPIRFGLGTALQFLFFFSGMPALIYQLVWERALFRIYGVNIECVTIVVAAFMLGLGVGSLAGGWVSRHRRLDLLTVLAVIEGATGIFGIASLRVFDRAGDFTVQWPLIGIAIASVLLLLVPTLLMGATLPILTAHLIRRTHRVGQSLGDLYFVNMLGGAVACLLAAVLLFPFLGMQKTIYVAAGFNFAIAFGALFARSRIVEAGEAREPAASSSRFGGASTRLSQGQALALAFLSGFVSLSYEIFFFRTISYMTGTNAAAFALMLCVFLAGLAFGANRTSRLTSGDMKANVSTITTALITASICGLAFIPALGTLVGLGHVDWVVAILLIYIVARNFGMFLPYLAECGVAADREAGPQVAYLYLASILGSASGSVFTGFLLADWLNLVGLSLALWCIAFVLVGAAIVAFGARGALSRQSRIVTPVVASALILIHCVIPIARIHEIQLDKGTSLVDGVENRSGIITVDAKGRVFGNGLYDGSFNLDLNHDFNDVWRAYALTLYNATPRRILMIGLSSGSWAQVVANAPGVEQVTIVEINSGYLQLIAKNPENASLLYNPKVEIIIDDGRRWLRRNPDRQFDAVISNTSFYFRSNASNVLSMEFMDLVKQHLSPRGTLFYHADEVPRTARTGCAAFVYGARLANFMIVSPSPLDIDPARWKRDLSTWQIDDKPVLDLSRTKDRATLAKLLSIPADLHSQLPVSRRRMEDCADIIARTGGVPVITDDNMGSEWRYNLGLDRQLFVK
jgi:spermidine synthase